MITLKPDGDDFMLPLPDELIAKWKLVEGDNLHCEATGEGKLLLFDPRNIFQSEVLDVTIED